MHLSNRFSLQNEFGEFEILKTLSILYKSILFVHIRSQNVYVLVHRGQEIGASQSPKPFSLTYGNVMQSQTNTSHTRCACVCECMCWCASLLGRLHANAKPIYYGERRWRDTRKQSRMSRPMAGRRTTDDVTTNELTTAENAVDDDRIIASK